MDRINELFILIEKFNNILDKCVIDVVEKGITTMDEYVIWKIK